jgi:hypothetical protein
MPGLANAAAVTSSTLPGTSSQRPWGWSGWA